MQTILVALALMLVLVAASFCARGWNRWVEEAHHEAASAERIP